MSGLDEKGLASAWPLIGYAPGNYQCTCGICQSEFVGDKRAFMCLECAARYVNTRLAARALSGASK